MGAPYSSFALYEDAVALTPSDTPAVSPDEAYRGLWVSSASGADNTITLILTSGATLPLGTIAAPSKIDGIAFIGVASTGTATTRPLYGLR